MGIYKKLKEEFDLLSEFSKNSGFFLICSNKKESISKTVDQKTIDNYLLKTYGLDFFVKYKEGRLLIHDRNLFSIIGCFRTYVIPLKK